MNHIIGVLNDKQRYEMIQKARMNYQIKFMDNPDIRIIQDRINRISVYNKDVLIHTITLAIVPLHISTEAIQGFSGENTRISLNLIFEELDRMKTKLKYIIDNPGAEKNKQQKMNDLISRIIL